MVRHFMQERPALVRGKLQSTLARFVIDQEQIVGLPKGAGRFADVSGAAGLGAHHQSSSPAIRSREANFAEKALSRRGVVRRGVHLERRLQGKSRWVPQPLFVIAEGGAFDSLAIVQPQTANQMRCAVEV